MIFKSQLTYIKKSKIKDSSGQFYHEYVCSCGKKCLKRKYYVDIETTKSCGCLRKSAAVAKANRAGVTPTNALEDPQESSINSLYSKYKVSAKKRALEFKIKKEHFKLLTSSNCYYCDSIPKAIIKIPNSRQGYIYNGVDRKINSLGYTEDNVVPCCKRCNFLKSNVDIEDFLLVIRTIYRNLKLED